MGMFYGWSLEREKKLEMFLIQSGPNVLKLLFLNFF